MNRIPKGFKALAPVALLFLVACGGEDSSVGNIEQPTPKPLSASDGVKIVSSASTSYVNLNPYVDGGAGSELSLRSVTLKGGSQACSQPQQDGLGFHATVSGSELCEYQYVVANSDNLASAKMVLMAGDGTEPVLPPIPVALEVGESQEIDLKSELGDAFPSGAVLDDKLTILGNGDATADIASETIRYVATTVGLSKVIYQLKGSGESVYTGTLDIAVSNGLNRPPVAEKFSYPDALALDETVEIDVGAYVSDPDEKQTVQLVGVHSFYAEVTPLEPENLSNTVFTFKASRQGYHYVAYEVTDQHGGYATSLVEVQVKEAADHLDPFNLNDIDTVSEKGKWTFNWTSASDTPDVKYQVCRSVPSEEYSCQELGSVVDKLTLTVPKPALFDGYYDFFIRATRHADEEKSNIRTVSSDELNDSIGELVSSNEDKYEFEFFGSKVDVSGDGKTIAVGAMGSTAASAYTYPAVYIFTNKDGIWSEYTSIRPTKPASDRFGSFAVSLSHDGKTLAVGAYSEASNASGINGDETDDSMHGAGAVYIYRLIDDKWVKTDYIKASNPDANDYFGYAISLSNDGNTLAVGSYGEDSPGRGVNPSQTGNNTGSSASGAAYVFEYAEGAWSQQAYIKASNAGYTHHFYKVALSGDGKTLAVGAAGESSSSTGVDGDQDSNASPRSGAVYVYRKEAEWVQQAYIKASNTDSNDEFSGNVNVYDQTVALSDDGNVLVVTTINESSNATHVGGDESNNSSAQSGAAYVFRYSDQWEQEAYIKASNTEAMDQFGYSVDISGDGTKLVIGARYEDSSSQGINGDQSNNSLPHAGAAYSYVYSDGGWAFSSYIKSPRPVSNQYFGSELSMSQDGRVLVAGVIRTTSSSNGPGRVYIY
ncbi:hypothetical protein M5252_004723 [Vibrio parahaemolyticus]|nr:hypothetical protein [Vibrio parahaemolyticus]EJE8775163.1 hypothetical protein [Vibrio parahaemolyticus]